MNTPLTPAVLARSLVVCACLAIAVVPVLAQDQPAPPTTPGESAVQLAPFQVSSTQGQGIITETSARAFKTNQSILDIPQAVIVVSNDMIQDTGMTDTSDILQFMGIANSFEGETTAMRGSRDNDPYIDDQPDNVPYEDDVFVDSYEIIKGASSVLYPNATLTGLVIKSTKKALPYSQVILSETVNQWGDYRTTIDINEPIGDFKEYKLAFRLVGAYERGDQYWYNLKNHVDAIHPSVLFQYHDSTIVHVAYDWQYLLHNAQNWSLMTPNGGLYTGWGRKEDGAPPNDEENMERRSLRLEFEQKLFGNWETRFETTYWYFQRFGTVVRPVSGVNWVNMTENYTAFRDDEPFTDWLVQDDTTGRYSIGPMKLESLFGFNMADAITVSRVTTVGPARTAFNPNNTDVLAVPITVAGVNSLPIPAEGTFGWPTAPTRTKTLTNNIYYQQNVDIIPNWLTLVGGFTWSTIETVTDTNTIVNSPYVAQDLPGQDWLHRFGATVHATKDIVLYALNTTRFSAQGGVDFSNNRLPNVQGKDNEVGFKTALFDGRLSSQFSWYDIVQTNQVIAGLGFNPVGQIYYIPIGTTTNRGVDGDLEFSLVPGWQLVLTGYNGTVRTQSAAQIALTYDNSWSLFTVYDFGKGGVTNAEFLKGLSIGGGLFRLGSFFQATSGYTVQSGYTLPALVKMREGNMVNFFINDRVSKNWAVKLSIVNLLDESFPIGGQSAEDLDPSEPITFSLQLQYRM